MASMILLDFVSGVFDAEVHPELPPARTMAGLLRCYLRRARGVMLETNHHRRTRISSSGSGRGGDGIGGMETTTTAIDSSGHATDFTDCFGLFAKGEEAGSYLVRTVPVQVSRKKV